MPITSTKVFACKDMACWRAVCCDTKYSKQMRVVSPTNSISRSEMELTF